jgi:hypothetical protein
VKGQYSGEKLPIDLFCELLKAMKFVPIAPWFSSPGIAEIGKGSS